MYNHRGVNRTSDNANYFSNTIAYSSFLFDNPYDIFVGFYLYYTLNLPLFL